MALAHQSLCPSELPSVRQRLRSPELALIRGWAPSELAPVRACARLEVELIEARVHHHQSLSSPELALVGGGAHRSLNHCKLRYKSGITNPDTPLLVGKNFFFGLDNRFFRTR